MKLQRDVSKQKRSATASIIQEESQGRLKRQEASNVIQWVREGRDVILPFAIDVIPCPAAACGKKPFRYNRSTFWKRKPKKEERYT